MVAGSPYGSSMETTHLQTTAGIWLLKGPGICNYLHLSQPLHLIFISISISTSISTLISISISPFTEPFKERLGVDGQSRILTLAPKERFKSACWPFGWLAERTVCWKLAKAGPERADGSLRGI